jgi:RNA polymerase sigma-70 factor (ECF subfamily)
MAVLYDRYSPIPYAVALRVLGNTAAAEDVLQEVFLQLWRRPECFDANRGNLGPWLAVIARNRAIDLLRKDPRETELADVAVELPVDFASDADRRQTVGKVRSVLREMAAPQRIALEMAYFEGLSHSEIAARTGEPLGTIKTRIRSGLLTLRKVLS